MELNYKLKDGVYVLDTPQEIDIANGILAINFDNIKNAQLVIDTLHFNIVNGKVVVDVKKLRKGTNILKVVIETEQRAVRVIPCQPLDLFDFNDKIKCKLATSLDVLSLVNRLQEKYNSLSARISEIEKSNPSGTKTAVNSIVDAFGKLQDRVEELEKNYDPTLI